MSTLACLVEVEGSELKRKFQFNDAHVVTLTRLKDAVKQCSLLSENLSCTGATATFKLYDKDFDCFVTIADDDVIPHLSTVRLTPGTNVQPQPTEKELTLTQLLSCSNLEMQQPSMSSAVPEKTNDIEDRDGKAYDLPDFGWLHGSLLMVANGEPLTSSLEIKIVEFLYQSVMPFTLYPSRVFYYKVISLFLERYPHLADSIGSGFSSWLVALRNKFKNERRKVQNHEQVQQNRAKFASKRSGTDAEQPSELRRTQRESDVHTASQHEDETSIERHEQWLRSEGKKTDPDEFQIKVRMAATHRSRAADLATLPVTVTVVKYPYIMASGRFFNEFESATSKEALQPVQRGVEEVIRLTVSGIIRTGSPLQEKAKHIPHLEDVGATRKKHMLAVAALNILGCSLRETSALSHLFVHENVDPMPMIPCVRFTGDSLDEAQHMYLHVDGTRLFRVMDGEEGIAAIFAAYWIFQAQYGKEVTNVMTFIERQWYKLNSTKAKQQVIKLVSKVVRATT